MGKLEEYLEEQRLVTIDAGLRAYERFLKRHNYTHSEDKLNAFSAGWYGVGTYQAEKREANEAGSLWWSLFMLAMIVTGVFGIIPTFFYFFVPDANINASGLYWSIGIAAASVIIAFEAARKGREASEVAQRDFDLVWAKKAVDE